MKSAPMTPQESRHTGTIASRRNAGMASGSSWTQRISPPSVVASSCDQSPLALTSGRAWRAIRLKQRPDLNDRQFQFEWDDLKAARNLLKHDITFEHASTIFNDPRMLSLADLEHSDTEDRWLSIGLASNGAILSLFTCGRNLIPPQRKFALSPPATRREQKSAITRKIYE